MEGILPLLQGAEGNLKVPYVAPPQFHGANISFYDFPQQNGFLKVEKADDLASSCKDIRALSSLLQSWLFFELLSAFLGMPLERTDFVADGDIELNQSQVHNYFRKWRSDLSMLSVVQRCQRQETLNELLNFAFWKCETFDDAADLLRESEDIFDTVALSAKLLISLLLMISEDTFASLRSPWREYLALKIPFAFAFRKVSLDRSILEMDKNEALRYLTKQPKAFSPLPPGDEDGGHATKLLLQRFADNGWCPSRSRQLCQSQDYLSVNNIASLNLKQLGSSKQQHQGCQKLKNCAAHQVADTSRSAYPFCHTERHDLNDQCDFLGVNKTEVNKIIDSGGIPIISMGCRKNNLDLKVERCTPWMTYTAISHIWSDGLGNPGGNSIYRCQLFRLREMIRQTYLPESSPEYHGENWWSRYKSRYSWNRKLSFRAGKPNSAKLNNRIYFWMDTLCIPRSPKPRSCSEYASVSEFKCSVRDFNRDENMRKLALQHITPIYAGAYNVLVLDSALQNMDAAGIGQLSGDKFAAFVLSTNWMQRGWTLEEGSLAQTCIFRLMGKPYEMSSSLQLSLTPLKWQDSPLDIAIFRARHMMPNFLKKALMDEKRQLTTDGKIMRSKFLKKLTRIPQFVRTWNSLHERSTTKPEDRLILFANLLDFNVHSLEGLNDDQKLPSLIQSCDELPLSLLYNTGSRLRIEANPEIGWIPTDINGIKLVEGATLRRIYPWHSRNQVCFKVDQSNCDWKSIIFLTTASTKFIPHTVNVFTVQSPINSDDHIDQEYYVEIQRLDAQGPDSNIAQRAAQTTCSQSNGTCIVIDLSSGDRSYRGFAGRGARFSISESSDKEMSLKFDAPIVAYTPEQWRRKLNRGYPTTLHYDMQRVTSRQQLFLKYDASLWHRKLARRPLLTQHPTSAWTVSFIIFIVTFLFLVFVYAVVLDIPSKSWKIKLIPWIAAGVALMPNRFMAMYTYKIWLNSFERKWAVHSAQESILVRLGIYGGDFGEMIAGRVGGLDLRFWRRSKTSSNIIVQRPEDIALRDAP